MYGNPYYAPYQYPYYAQNTDFKQQFNQPTQTMPQTQQIPQNANLTVKNDMLWVLNKNEADSYPVAPNCSVVLWDKNAPTIYVKSVNVNGIPSMRTLDFVERTETPQKSPVTDEKILEDKFVTKEQFDELKDNFDNLRAMCDGLTNKISTKTNEKPKNMTKKGQGEVE